ncbi:indolepyruvate oxidoreductase subunit beta family protein [Halioxenophilus aromaticivorans]|uniref:Indolepyruvate oxidoreductase subunit beta family protein n=1 Tax=Halioxenophilus aromaticivorans TaxID=1306992 RepID=A0AAV3TZH3_9ALTE
MQSKSSIQPITIAISAMGGQGGGVLSNWLRYVAEHNGYVAQSTSVPGVAQRTGATIYYLEIFAKSDIASADRPPVLGLSPTPGNIDVLIAAELVEAGRSIQRGFVSEDKTTLIATTHRSYTVIEKSAPGNGRVDSAGLIEACHSRAKRCIAFDMESIAKECRSVISSVLLGAVAGSGCLPFTREAFEAAIKAQGVAVDTNLLAFSVAYERASRKECDYPHDGVAVAPHLPSQINSVAGQKLLDRIKSDFPEASQPWVWEGVKQVADYQDVAYANKYLDRLLSLRISESEYAGAELLSSCAKQLALWMCFQDTIQVARQKIGKRHFNDIRTEVKAQAGQLVYPVEYLHPRIEEICDTLPPSFARVVAKTSWLRKFIDNRFCQGKKVHSGTVMGYCFLWGIASLTWLRPLSVRFQREEDNIEHWMQLVAVKATENPNLALVLAKLPNLIKGYGDSHERGSNRYRTIIELVERHPGIGRVTVESLLRTARDAESDKTFAAVVKTVEMGLAEADSDQVRVA